MNLYCSLMYITCTLLVIIGSLYLNAWQSVICQRYVIYILCTVIEYVVRMMTNNDNVESSLLTSILLNICNLYK